MKKQMKSTRFAELYYAKQAPGMWSFYHISPENGSIPSAIGARYKTQIELLSDAQRFAEERGFENSIS